MVKRCGQKQLLPTKAPQQSISFRHGGRGSQLPSPKLSKSFQTVFLWFIKRRLFALFEKEIFVRDAPFATLNPPFLLPLNQLSP